MQEGKTKTKNSNDFSSTGELMNILGVFGLLAELNF